MSKYTNNINIESRFFEFKNTKDYTLHTRSEYSGWSGLKVIKFNIRENENLDNHYFKKNFSSIANKEKIFVVTLGELEIEHENERFLMKEFDALTLFSDEKKYEITCRANSEFYLIGSEKLLPKNYDPHHFNFKRDITPRDLWGGKCISRPYEGNDLNLVLFDLKPGFKFEDKGHDNEQITWLIFGKMDFYANGEHKTLNSDNGVDIGPNHIHGGVSGGAMGFDAFFPKRQEIKYKK